MLVTWSAFLQHDHDLMVSLKFGRLQPSNKKKQKSDVKIIVRIVISKNKADGNQIAQMINQIAINQRRVDMLSSMQKNR